MDDPAALPPVRTPRRRYLIPRPPVVVDAEPLRKLRLINEYESGGDMSWLHIKPASDSPPPSVTFRRRGGLTGLSGASPSPRRPVQPETLPEPQLHKQPTYGRRAAAARSRSPVSGPRLANVKAEPPVRRVAIVYDATDEARLRALAELFPHRSEHWVLTGA